MTRIEKCAAVNRLIKEQRKEIASLTAEKVELTATIRARDSQILSLNEQVRSISDTKLVEPADKFEVVKGRG